MSLAQGNNTPTRPRIEPRSPDPESDALTTRPVRPPLVCFRMVKTRNETLRNQVNTLWASRSRVRPSGKRGQLRASLLRSISLRPGTKKKRLPLKPRASGQPHASEKPNNSRTSGKSGSHTCMTRKIKKRQHAP